MRGRGGMETLGKRLQRDKDRLRAELDGAVAPEALADVMGTFVREHDWESDHGD